jgi:hypothetical protein
MSAEIYAFLAHIANIQALQPARSFPFDLSSLNSWDWLKHPNLKQVRRMIPMMVMFLKMGVSAKMSM